MKQSLRYTYMKDWMRTRSSCWCPLLVKIQYLSSAYKVITWLRDYFRSDISLNHFFQWLLGQLHIWWWWAKTAIKNEYNVQMPTNAVFFFFSLLSKFHTLSSTIIHLYKPYFWWLQLNYVMQPRRRNVKLIFMGINYVMQPRSRNVKLIFMGDFA